MAKLTFFENEILRELLFIVSGLQSSQSFGKHGFLQEVGHLRKAIDLIEANPFEPFTLAALSAVSGTSVSTLTRAFRDTLGMTPMAYQRDRRLDESRRLLKDGKYSVEETSYLVGYESVSAFCRSYKRKFGSSPRHT